MKLRVQRVEPVLPVHVGGQLADGEGTAPGSFWPSTFPQVNAVVVAGGPRPWAIFAVQWPAGLQTPALMVPRGGPHEV